MEDRVRTLNDAPVRAQADYVLYWSQMNRRVDSNHALAWAILKANELRLPVLFYEGLTCAYKEANDRTHTFLLEGVPETSRRLDKLGVGYCFYLRRRATVPARIGVRYVVVDSSCIVPLSRLPAREYAAYTIRPKIRRLLPQYLVACLALNGTPAWCPRPSLPSLRPARSTIP
jgi:deoxyribodipyrimidine photo-lyase